MITNDFTAAMTEGEFLDGEIQHVQFQKSRKLAMIAGLTKSSDELARCWKDNSELYLSTISIAIAAYERNKVLEELLMSCIARLSSVVDVENNESIDLAMEILRTNTSTYNN